MGRVEKGVPRDQEDGNLATPRLDLGLLSTSVRRRKEEKSVVRLLREGGEDEPFAARGAQVDFI
jgi:hypothetical protein